MNVRLIAISLLALAAHTSASARTPASVPPHQAGTPADPDAPSKRISISDLNLTNPEGAAALRRRLDRTVIALSGGPDASRQPQVRAARARAQAQADALIAAARS